MKALILILFVSFLMTGCIDFSSGGTDSEQPTNNAPEEIIEEEPESSPPPEEEPPEISDPPVEEEPPVEDPDPIITNPDPIEEEPVEEPIVEETTLSWNAPFTRENGDSLELYEIDYYLIIHYYDGTSEEIRVEYSADTHAFDNLPSGVHEFEMKTVDIDGLVSEPSERVKKVID